MRYLLTCQSCILLLATRKRVSWIKQTHLITFSVRFQLVLYVLFYCLRVFFHRIHIVAGLQIIQPRFGWILLCTQERLSPSRDLLFRAVPAEKANVTALYQVPASIAFVIPQRQNLSGVLLKPLRAWDYPSSRPFVPKRRCLLARWHSSPRKCYRFYL